MSKAKKPESSAMPWPEVHRLMKMVSEMGLSELLVRSPAIEVRIVGRVAGTGSAASDPPALEPGSPLEVSGDELSPITSPMVGTFYKAPKPGADPFVEIGKPVKTGDIVCIIEAMKLMNEIEADREGVVEQIYVTDGQPVEYGQKLFGLRPAAT